MNEIKELHYRYIVSYLLSALVLLVALKYYDVPNLFDKFSFALTLSSLLLAILAIFYTIISAQKQDMQLTKLIETNTSLDKAALEIKSAAQDVRLFAQEAPQHFQAIGQKLDNLSENYRALNSIEQTPAKDGEVTTEISIDINENQFYLMIGHMQFSAMAVLYLFMLAYQNSKTIEREILDEVGLNRFDYAVGFLNGIETTGLISMRIHKGAIIPVSCAEVVIEGLKNNLLEVLKLANPSDSERLSTLMTAIETRFA